jgi:hypothetical protein
MILLVKRIFFVFIPIAIFIYILEINDNQYAMINTSVSRVQMATKVNAKDYLFVGPSYCYGGVDVSAFDSIKKDVYILGVATAGPYYYKVLIDDYLKACRAKPKSIFLCLHLGIFSEPMDNWSSYPIHRYLNHPISNELVFSKYTSFGEYVLMLRKSVYKTLQHLTIDKAKYIDAKQSNDLTTMLSRGFSASEEIYLDTLNEKFGHLYKKFTISNFNKLKADFLLEYVEELNGKGIDIVFFEVPTYKLSSFLSADYIAQYEQFKANIKTSGMKLIEDSSHTQSNPYYSSLDHLNHNGAIRYTKFLIKEIQKLK